MENPLSQVGIASLSGQTAYFEAPGILYAEMKTTDLDGARHLVEVTVYEFKDGPLMRAWSFAPHKAEYMGVLGIQLESGEELSIEMNGQRFP